MRWQGRRESSNVEDLRNELVPEQGFGGGRFSLLSLPIGNKARLFLVIGVVIAALMFGGDPIRWLSGDFSTSPPSSERLAAGAPSDDDAKRFVAVVLADTEDVWTPLFKERGATYHMPKLVLFRRAVQSGCGFADAAIGPFYCPRDSRVYVDLDFLTALQKRLGASGDFAEAYVIAHEVGHHVQHSLGTLDTVRESPGQEGAAVRTELQADCFAGIWAHYTDHIAHNLEPGDIEEAMNAASAVGDDRLQKREQGYVVPDSFTHGTGQQRQHWFKRGYDSGDIEDCNTFSARKI